MTRLKMKTYLQRFIQMVEDLRQYPGISVTHFKTFPPITKKELSEIHQHLGYELDKNILDFFKETNGLQLLWSFEPAGKRDEEPDWKMATRHRLSDKGVIMIWPLKKIVQTDWAEQIYYDWMLSDNSMIFLNKKYNLYCFSEIIKPFDLFSNQNDMAFLLDGSPNPPVILGEDQQGCYNESAITDFKSYLEFLLANKGLVSKRKEWFSKQEKKYKWWLPGGSFWTKDNRPNLESVRLSYHFPKADQAGASVKGINTQQMGQKSAAAKSLQQEDVFQMMEQHHLFLQSGGAGGQWKTFHINGLVFGVYMTKKGTKGEQASFEYKKLGSGLDLQEIQLPFASFCGANIKHQDFSDADLSYCLFTDANLEGTVFTGAELQETDFSRANLKGASFVNAHLKNTDFENCNLKNADFTGAIIDGAQFPGANLEGVIF